MYLTVLMDVEDLIDPESDDIAGVCADILADEGVKATLCVVGERARQWRARGRTDIIEKMKQHDIGYHTNFHSVHPTISEYVAPLSLDAGVQEVLRRESPGVSAIEEVFGAKPSCYGGPGNTWGPAVCEAMRQLGVPAFVYAYTCTPQGGPHRFAGINAYPNGRGLNDGAYQDDAASADALARFKSGIAEDVQSGLIWQQAFIGHPTRILHERFWDDPLFIRGANPPMEQWKAVPRKSDQDLDAALKNFRHSIREIRNLPGVELKTIREMNEILGSQTSVPITNDDRAATWPTIEKQVLGMANWVIVPGDIDLSGLAAQTNDLLPTLERFN